MPLFKPADRDARAPRIMARREVTRGLASLPLVLAACATDAPGEAPGGRPYHHTADGFRNPPGSPARGGDFGDWVSFFYRGFSRDNDIRLPERHVLPNGDAERALARESGDNLTWLGHACFLIRLGGRTILTDPYLSDHASPLPPFGPKRFAPPGLLVGQLPQVDVLLLSHNHYDHLDLPTIDALAGKARIQVVVPLGLAGYFTGRGFTKVEELDWGQRAEIGQLRVTALPAIHFSKRTLFDRNRTLWAAYAIEGHGRRLHFGGDTGYGPVYPELGQQLEPFDLGIVPIGAYEPRALMRAAHATPEEAVQIGRDLRAKRLVGMHWGTIRLTDEPPFEPPERFRAAARAAGYVDDDAWVMSIGETRPI